MTETDTLACALNKSWDIGNNKRTALAHGNNTQNGSNGCKVIVRNNRLRLTYNGNTMYASVSGAAVDYTDKDFDGETVRTLSCGERDYAVQLTDKGIAGIYNSSDSRVATGRYTEEGGVLTIVMNGSTFVSDGDGNITVQFTVSSGGFGPFGGTSTVERSFPIDGSLPPETSASGESSGDASGDASGESSEESSGEADASAETSEESFGEAEASAETDSSGEEAGGEADASAEPAA